MSVDLSSGALKLCLLFVCSFASALGQDQSPAVTPPSAKEIPEAPDVTANPGAIQGTVLSGATGQPLRRAQVLLRPIEVQAGNAKAGNAKAGATYQITDETGGFSFSKIPSGRYTITVHRDGYLPLAAGRIGSYKMPPIFAVQSGQTISSFEFRLTPWGIVSGKIKFDDGEPAVNVAVQLYRSYHERGRHGYSAAAGTRTDDRGEYRLHGIEPGSYYVAALYQAPARPADAEEEARKNSYGDPLPTLGYAVTFFPEVQRMSDAAAVKVAPGQEIAGIDIFLRLVHTVRIRGRVVSGVNGAAISNPSVTLRWNDPDNTA
ncbi:MAG: carboxypeptidase regulatory-like domain-containing protein, partial [Bryobacterales bacterium]|nr:carboxypeptidase regulatory-like domain-containing protein [Bryobacterales bacterium]